MKPLKSLSFSQTKLYFADQIFPLGQCEVMILASHLINLLKARTDLKETTVMHKISDLSAFVRFAEQNHCGYLCHQSYFDLIDKAACLSNESLGWRIRMGLEMAARFMVTGSLELSRPPILHNAKAKISPFFTLTDAFQKIEKLIEHLKTQDYKKFVFDLRLCKLRKFCEFLDRSGASEITPDLFKEFALTLSHIPLHYYYFLDNIRIMDRLFNMHWEELDTCEPMTPLPLPAYDEAVSEFQSCVLQGAAKPLAVLIPIAEKELYKFGESTSSVGQYFKMFRRFRWFCFKHGVEFFDESEAEQYLAFEQQLESSGQQLKWKTQMANRAIRALRMLNKSDAPALQSFPFEREYKALDDPTLEELRQMVRAWCAELGYAQATADEHDHVLRKTISVCGLKCKKDFENLRARDVDAVLAHFASVCNKDSRSTLLRILKRLLKLFHERGLIKQNLAPIVIIPRVVKNYIAPFLTIEDQAKVHIALAEFTARERAVVLLALELGFREADILNLRLSNLDFKRKRISLVQQKTRVPITHVLYEEIAAAIKEYLLKERPRPCQDDEPVFCSSFPPFGKISSVYAIVKKVLLKAGVEAKNKTVFGPHLLRYSLVHGLMAAHTNHSIITQVLGHVSPDSDRNYLSTSYEMLRECSLDLSLIGLGNGL